MAVWRVKLLGEFSLLAPDGQKVNLPGRRHQALMAYVLLAKGKIVNREKVLGLLWGSRSNEQARASLRGVLSEIRRTLLNISEPFIGADRTNIYIDEHLVELDVDQLVNATRSSSIDTLAKAFGLYGGELLESINLNEQQFEDWKQVEQQNLQATYRKVLARYLHILNLEDKDEELERVAHQLLELDGADEDAHRALMNLYFNQGKTSLALRQFDSCKERLKTQYNSDVSDETLSLLSFIKSPSEDPQQRIPSGKLGESEQSRKLVDTMPEIALAILPIVVTQSEQIGQEFGELISEEIIGAAAKFKWFRVIPSSETFRQKLKSLSAVEIARKTGAKYVMFGRIRKIRDEHTLSVGLVDCVNNRTFWSERFVLPPEALIYPEDIVDRVVGQLDVKIRASEISQAHRLDRESLSAYQCTLLALSNIYDLSKEAYEDSENLFAKATKLNSNNSWFYSIWALWKMFCLGQGWGKHPEEEFERAGELAHQAIKRDPDDALALVILGHFESFWGRNLEQGKKLIDYSLIMNPYSSFAWMISAATYAYCGEPQEALRRLEKSKSLCPVEQHFEFLFDAANCVTHLFKHDPEQAVEWGYKTVRENPRFTNGYKHLLVALGHLGKVDEIEYYSNMLREIDPSFNAESFLESFPFAKDADREFYRKGLLYLTAVPDANAAPLN
ncbi:MAG: BTAD domain-containing putative transcriptional regulator [Gammaproteobacteria bacterium]